MADEAEAASAQVHEALAGRKKLDPVTFIAGMIVLAILTEIYRAVWLDPYLEKNKDTKENKSNESENKQEGEEKEEGSGKKQEHSSEKEENNESNKTPGKLNEEDCKEHQKPD